MYIDELRQFVEFYDSDSIPAYYLEDGRHAGRRILLVLKYKSVPTSKLLLLLLAVVECWWYMEKGLRLVARPSPQHQGRSF